VFLNPDNVKLNDIFREKSVLSWCRERPSGASCFSSSGFAMKEELKKEMLKKAVDGKLSCAAAMKIAQSLDLQFREVGEAANELGIKIKNCQLGCF
jgi:hypothetical protein